MPAMTFWLVVVCGCSIRLTDTDAAKLLAARAVKPAVVKTERNGVARYTRVGADRGVGIEPGSIIGFEPSGIDAELRLISIITAKGDRNFGFKYAIRRIAGALMSESSPGYNV